MTERKQVKRLRELWQIRGTDTVADTVIDLVEVILETDDRLRTIESWISDRDPDWQTDHRPTRKSKR